MTPSADALLEEFTRLLAPISRAADEGALERGYELGRKAVEEKIGLLEVLDAYHRALAKRLAPVAPGADRLAQATGELLTASVAPYEMTHRGYQETVARLQKANHDLSAANDELEAFSYTASHDLRAPLRSIAGFSKILLSRYAGVLDADGRDMLERVAASAQKMDQLIEGLLRLSRLGRAAMKPGTVDLSALAGDILAELRRSAPERRVDAVVEAGLRVQGDLELLRAAMTNLLSNAWKFTARKPEAHIEFGCQNRPGSRVFFVRDDGAGFDMQGAAKLFAPFQRLHAQTEFSGTGIGLTTVRRIIARHGGAIWAEGEVGRGAVFYFTLDGQAARG